MTTRLGKICDTLLEAGWLLGITITPVFFNVYSSRVFEPDKLTTLRALAVVMACLWLVRFLEARFHKTSALRFSWRTPMVLPALLTMAIYLISSAFSLVPYTSFIGSYQRLQGTHTLFGYLVLFFAILTSLRTRAQLSRLITVLILNSLPVSLYGIVQHYGLDPLPWAGDVTTRVASNMGNAIFVAAYLIMIVPLTAARLVASFRDILTREDAKLGDVLRASGYIFLLAVQLLTIWNSGSRGPWLGTVVLGFVFPYVGLLLLLRREVRASESREPWRDLLKGAGFGLGVLVLSGGLAVLAILALGGTIGLYIGGGLAALTFGGLWLYCIVERKGWRWLWLGWGTVGLVVALALVFINIPGPLQTQARKVAALRRLTTITQLQSGTGKVRGLIWQGAVNLIEPHPPIQYPDGSVDRLNALRPIIGYGPESMYVAYNSFYPPELGHYESRTASPDRSHNETLDSLVITGVLGLLVYLFTFISVFAWGMHWLGWLGTWKDLARYLGLDLFFAVLFFVIAWQVEGAYLFAVAIPLGVLVGTMLYLTLEAFRYLFRFTKAERSQVKPHALLIGGILASVLAHFVEINFGIAIAATRTTFWALAGVLVALGEQWIPEVTPVAPESTYSDAASTASRQRRRHRRRRRTSSQAMMPPWVAAVLALSLAAVFLLGTLAFDFINNPERLSDAGEIFMRSLTMKYHPEKTKAYGALMIFVFTWILFGVIGLSEYDREGVFGVDSEQRQIIAAFIYAGVALVGLLLFGSLVAGHQASLTRIQVATIEDVVGVAVSLANLLLRYYGLIFTVLIALGLVLFWEEPRLPHTWGHPVSLLVLVVTLLSSVFIIRTTSYNLIRADIVYKQGGVFANNKNPNDKQIGIAHYEKALEYVPREDYYYLFLGKAYLELTQTLPLRFEDLSQEQQAALQQQWQNSVNWSSLTPEQQEQQLAQWKQALATQQLAQQQDYFETTEEVLNRAREINPLNTDHSANLARFYKSWAAQINLQLRQQDLREAERAKLQTRREELLHLSLENYEIALTLSPHNPILWNEKAQLYALDLGNMVAFHETITQSLEVDDEFEQTWMLLGDMYSSRGNVDGAIAAYAQALEVQSNCTVWRVLGTLQAQQGYWNDAVATLEEGITKCSRSRDLWDFYRVLAIAYANTERGGEALQTAQQALELAPDNQKAVVQQLIDSLQAQMAPPVEGPEAQP